MTDKKTRRICAAAVFAALLIVFILPIGDTGRIAGAFVLVPAAILIPIIVKKRSIHSINSKQVLLVVTVIAIAIILVYYLSGIKFGFYKNPYSLGVKNFFKFFLPILFCPVNIRENIINITCFNITSLFNNIFPFFI